MFKAYNNSIKETVNIYETKEENGYVMFLMNYNNEWVWENSDNFKQAKLFYPKRYGGEYYIDLNNIKSIESVRW
jgi:ABC-type glycerol-3-phosphate transport system substrate-binding protein